MRSIPFEYALIWFNKKGSVFCFKFKQRFFEYRIYENLSKESVDYWLDLARKYLIDSFSVTITAKPSEDLMKSISDEDKLRVEERKRTLGKKGLKELKIKVENAIEENDVILFKP